MDDVRDRDAFGPNIWLVDEMYRRYVENPDEVGEAWREFFEDYDPGLKEPRTKPEEPPSARPIREVRPPGGDGPAARARTAPARETEPRRTEARRQPAQAEGSSPLTGVAARIAENMERSLGVPTATSVRTIPAKLLEENRRTINRHLAGGRGGKVSFTHLIGYAVLKALEARPAMKVSYTELDGKPAIVQHKHVNFGLAVDVERKGTRTLLVPNIKRADELDFAAFFAAYEALIRRVRNNELKPDDFQGTNVTLTNPGTVGTSLSVPRLMPEQGVIVGTGAIGYPIEYEGADPRTIARLGVSKTLTVTSTYDHRVIQGAESGEFLAKVHELLLGGDRFYDEVFASLGIPHEPVRWSRDHTALDGTDTELEKQSRVIQLINMYRVRGHLLADLNPLGSGVLAHPELDFARYGLTLWDLDREFITDGLPGPRRQPLRDILDTLRDSYCRRIGVEYMHISDPERKRWIQQRVEVPEWRADLPIEDKRHILDRLIAAEAFERFLHTKYIGHRRYSIEGADAVIPMLDALYERAADEGYVEVVMGMSHRGRLNVLANILGKSFQDIFHDFEGDVDPDTVQGSGDVVYHVGMTGMFRSRAGNELRVIMASNPSHLESVDPVVEGMARAKQDMIGDGAYDKVLPVLLHGDASFAGQGVVAETFNMSDLVGYQTGGTVHIVVNNMIGFTTDPMAGRSSTYATDIAKMIQAPILHVNGDDPEACVKVVRLAYEYRKTFKKDIVIDFVCYRRHGHQEVDEPSFTQPLMYKKIEERRTVRKLYTEYLLNRGELTVQEAEEFLNTFQRRLDQAFEEIKESERAPHERTQPPPVVGVGPPQPTGVPRERLEHIHRTVTTFPEGFDPHPKLKRLIERRRDMLDKDAIDWAAAEALSWGSLLLEGVAVRLSGEDSRRGTFNQRHAVYIDYETEEEYCPLANLAEDQAPFMAYDSLLSEFAALGFEYGYSVSNGDCLTMWEAQFGDFANGGQVIIDQYITSGEDKWGQHSGLVMLLPHGYEGQGPEHSSARIERYLTLCANGNMQVTQPTTAAQYFHLLRRQAHRSVKKPLVVFTPKSLLRSPQARSKTMDLTAGYFFETIDDPAVADRDAVRKIVLCTGKVAYSLMQRRDERKDPSVAVVRLEQLYPFPEVQLAEIYASYPNAREVRWVQEEPENMGAWAFVHAQMHAHLPPNLELHHVCRPESPSPATGSKTIHELEQKDLLERAFADFV